MRSLSLGFFLLFFLIYSDLLDAVMRVTESDLQRVGEMYMRKLFDNDQSRTVIVCHPSKVEATKEAFKS